MEQKKTNKIKRKKTERKGKEMILKKENNKNK